MIVVQLLFWVVAGFLLVTILDRRRKRREHGSELVEPPSSDSRTVDGDR